jgi:hypothetical protein
MIANIRNLTHRILPKIIDKRLRAVNFYFLLKITQYTHKNALKRLREKGKIKVAFFIFKESVWKFEVLYQLMKNDNRFEPIIVICPYIDYGEDTMRCNMNQAYNYFKTKDYNVVKTLNEKSGEWLNVKRIIKPDIIFFSAPWYITKSEYLIENYKKILTCYVPYTFVISYLYQGYFNQYMQNFVWKFFVETQIHKRLAQQYAQNKGVNTIVSGYPGMDNLLAENYHSVDVWKIKDKKVKRIIWSPHHTIRGLGDTLDYSNFLLYSDFMFELTQKYQGKIQIAFKPHPSLRSKLNKEEIWGKEKTDKYFNKWAEFPNGQLNEGEYINLFSTSDGMINDSSAFIVEYLYTNKPSIFLASDDFVSERFNEIGKIAISKLYIGKCKEDIEEFVKKVIIGGKDFMKNDRIVFYESVIKPPNNVTASENIFNYLKTEIF